MLPTCCKVLENLMVAQLIKSLHNFFDSAVQFCTTYTFGVLGAWRNPDEFRPSFFKGCLKIEAHYYNYQVGLVSYSNQLQNVALSIYYSSVNSSPLCSFVRQLLQKSSSESKEIPRILWNPRDITFFERSSRLSLS